MNTIQEKNLFKLVETIRNAVIKCADALMEGECKNNDYFEELRDVTNPVEKDESTKRGLLMLESVLLSMIREIGDKDENELFGRIKIAIAMLIYGSESEPSSGGCEICGYSTTYRIDGDYYCPFCKWRG